MSRAQDILEKVAAAHIEGYFGSGKTTLMNQLKKEFPDFVFFDIDDFKWKAIQTLTKSTGGVITDKENAELYHLAQKYLNAWLKKQKKPAVLVGYSDGFDMSIVDPSGKILFGSNPMKTAFRVYKRDKEAEKAGDFPKIGKKDKLVGFIRTTLDAYKFNKEKKSHGYKPMSPKKIKRYLKAQEKT